jgi:ligand-binding sensor domain-containing protein
VGAGALAVVAALQAAQAPAPAPARAWQLAAPAALYTNTATVTDLLVEPADVWVATGGGVEAYDPMSLGRRRLYTTADGLAENAVLGLEREGPALVARTARARCFLDRPRPAAGPAAAAARFRCVPAPPRAPEAPAAADEIVEGARVTVTRPLGEAELVGTAGRGLWLRDTCRLRPLTPGGQICGNHVVAAAAWRGRVWLGTFDQGLCSRATKDDAAGFHGAAVPFKMINDLVVTPRGLFVAGSDGLWWTADGVRFRRHGGVTSQVINDLAYDAVTGTLYATAPGALWRIPRGGSGGARALARPGGSRSLQAVEARRGIVWLATEDRGVIRMGAGGDSGGGGDLALYDRAAGAPSSWALDVAEVANGDAYAATLRDGVVRITRDGRMEAVAGLPSPWILHLVADPAPGGPLWIGTQGGAARLASDGRLIPFGGLPDTRVHAIAPLADGLWVGTEGGTAVYR